MWLLFLDVGLHFFFSAIFGKVTFFPSLSLWLWDSYHRTRVYILARKPPQSGKERSRRKSNSLLDQSLAQKLKKNHNWSGKIANYSMFDCTYISSIYAVWVLNRLNHVWLFATLWTIALQASLSMGFSRQKFWSGLPCAPGSIYVICC